MLEEEFGDSIFGECGMALSMQVESGWSLLAG